MSSSRLESHLAQQIRRDKLRIQDSSHHNLQEFLNNNPGQSSLHPGFNLDQVRNVRNASILVDEPVTGYSSSEMVNFSNPLSAPRNNNSLQCQELGASEPAIKVMMHQFPSSSISLGNWRNSATHQGVDWNVLNYASSSMSSERNQNSFLASEINNNVSSNYQHFGKPCFNELTETQSSSLSREIHKKLGVNVMHHNPSSSYQNALQDIVKSSASISACNGSDMASLMQQTGQNIWVSNANELAQLQPSYLNQQNQQSHFTCGNLWTNKPIPSDSTPQSLSLSLSSNSQSKPFVSHFEEASASASAFASDHGISKDPPKHVKPTIISRDCGKSPLQDYVRISPNSNSTSYQNVGPLGPFTGYATILKSSRFLNYAQQLLQEFCCVSDPRFANAFDVPNRVSEEVSASTSTDAVIETRGVAPKGGNLGSSSSMFYRANENITERVTESSFGFSPQPDYQQKKAKLLYMQEEVGWRYKQYHHQMQMVVSSFESVAGLSSATPYVSLALKSISRHFRCLKNLISDQLKLISEVLGEDLSIPTTGTSYKVDNNITNPRSGDQRFQKNKGIRNNKALLEPQQHVWRPQRGLPEPAVAILKAWLFEHFLHPYPTDNDKHMLATQTGLSRNQVSNWFINARVRVWKPMVEEIHMLETKGITSDNQNTNENERTEGGTRNPRMDKPLSKFGMYSIHESQFQCMEMGSTIADESGLNHEIQQWSQEKRSKLEFRLSNNSSMHGSMTGFLPYRHRGGVEVEGLGSVSLTLGLRHGVEGVQNQQQLQEEQLIHHFGGHIYDP
ncbi:hypothetical protein TanjilG_04312 [Lupinus angustifolius]|uniref:Homeobox domain-containing protein n=1 Tax=Lupinus angustifolius TaxID=3871 RepID=A0A4P1RQ28_LUPAN|nr:PREDICTED: BEL1-like homeodomain protein 4 [Lupinus angustifolius]XP_019436285.1 PREDICTED: BEL1-like homeodomain protein 4 [Lupinus angustifolius]OIW15777.1 hypothetical protein TanjilG_04312 [Lupinus angustifolius]